MASSDLSPEPIVAREHEQAELAKIEELLNLDEGEKAWPLQLVAPTGEAVELPKPVFNLLRQVVHQLLLGKGVTITTFHQPLTIWEAATLLNVPSKEMEQLLDKGVIPCTKSGVLRRIRFEDLMSYRNKQFEQRRQDLAERTEEHKGREERGINNWQ